MCSPVGFFAGSVRREGYDYDFEEHPPFDVFARGLMASPQLLDFIRDDAELRCRFPPTPLSEMTPGLFWLPPEEYQELMESYRRHDAMLEAMGKSRCRS
jgi:hypothetical protein